MDAEQTIAEIESLERIFAVPDAQAAEPERSCDCEIVGTTRSKLTVHGFDSGNAMASVLVESAPEYSD